MTNREVFDKIFNNPTFENTCCINSCEGVPCTSCDWWNKEYVDLEKKKPSFKIFISQPMKDRTTEEIMLERNKIVAKWTNASVEFIDSYFANPGKNSIDSLGKSISLMCDADLVVFAPGWEKAHGCKVEHQVAVYYGISVCYY